MLSVLSSFKSWVFGAQATYKNDETINYDDLLSKLPDGLSEDLASDRSETNDAADSPCAECQERMGTVTDVSTNMVTIDRTYRFEMDAKMRENVKVGKKVTYLVYRLNASEEFRVKKIISYAEENWDDEVAEDVLPADDEDEGQVLAESGAMYRSVIGQVSRRQGRIVVVSVRSRGEIHCDLDDVNADFTPLVGDWVSLDALVQTSENSIDFSGEILEVTCLRPLRSKVVDGEVKFWDQASRYGYINDDIFFQREMCVPGYLPARGDKVIVEAIESSMGGPKVFRALRVAPERMMTASLPTTLDPNHELNDRTLFHNKKGVFVSKELDFGTVSMGEKKSIKMTVENSGDAAVSVLDARFMTSRASMQIDFAHLPILPRVLSNGNFINFRFSCEGRYPGYCTEIVVIDFEGFKIARRIYCVVKTEAMQARTKSNNTKMRYNHHSSREMAHKSQAVMLQTSELALNGLPLVKSPAFIYKKTPPYKVPESYYSLLAHPAYELEARVCEAIRCLQEDLTPQNYLGRFHELLYLAEAEGVLDLRRYDMQSVTFTQKGEYLSLEVPGLSEGRPSLLVGDVVQATALWSSTREPYWGVIHKTLRAEVYLKFSPSFHFEYTGANYCVRFRAGRSAWKRSHLAISQVTQNMKTSWLFPTHVSLRPPQLEIEEEIDEADSASTEPTPSPQDTSASEMNGNVKPVDTSDVDVKKTSPAEFKKEDEVQTTQPNLPLQKMLRLVQQAASPSKSDVIQADRKPVDNVRDINGNRHQSEKISTGSDESNKTESKQSGVINGNGYASPRAPSSLLEKLRQANVKNRNGKAAVSNGVGGPPPVVNGEKKKDTLNLRSRRLRWINSRLNSRQKDAVRNVLRGEARPLPYIIFGPPGTGKTMTLVETILQIYSLLPGSRLLVSTPSNSSADLIAERLLDTGHLKPGDMVRLVAHHIADSESVPPRLLPYSATVDVSAQPPKVPEEINKIPALSSEVLGRHRLTIGTCVALGNLVQLSLPKDHFTHTIIDEAGQSIEPESMIPLSLLSRENGQVILAGDPLQLGPVVASKLAQSKGLGISHLARLLQRVPYQRDLEGFPETAGYNPRLVTRLTYNYRSLPSILRVCSDLFYDSELIPTVHEETSTAGQLLTRLTPLLELPRRFGVVFMGVRGENQQEGDCPSWYNMAEIGAVTEVTNKLTVNGVSADDIGIITPYRKQVQRIRHMLDALNIPLPKIGTVEEFQGQERMVIILSTVRSSAKEVLLDKRHHIGFVASPQRMNVAISRAKALLVVIGDPHLLASDPCWRGLIKYCWDEKSYFGSDLPSL